jgi:hypothetical protein
MENDSALIVKIEVQEVGEHFYASSQDVPGLHVCGGTREQAYESAMAALPFLFKHNRGLNVRIVPARSANVAAAPYGSCDRLVALAA